MTLHEHVLIIDVRERRLALRKPVTPAQASAWGGGGGFTVVGFDLGGQPDITVVVAQGGGGGGGIMLQSGRMPKPR